MTEIQLALLVGYVLNAALGAALLRWALRLRRERGAVRGTVLQLRAVAEAEADEGRAAADEGRRPDDEGDSRPDGKTLYLDLLGTVRVATAGVRFRAAPGLTILGTWQDGQTLLWMGVARDNPDWWHVWNPANWDQVGWTHRLYLRVEELV